MRSEFLKLFALLAFCSQGGLAFEPQITNGSQVNKAGLVTIGDKRYYISEENEVANVKHVTQFCATFLDMHMVDLQTQEENDLLKSYLIAQGLGDVQFWTSGRRLVGVIYIYYFWATCGQMLTYFDFGGPEMNGGEEVCFLLHAQAGLLQDLCATEHRFICEAK